MADGALLSAGAGIGSNNPKLLAKVEQVNAKVIEDPLDTGFDHRRRPIITDAGRKRLSRIGEVVVGTGIGFFGIRTV